MFGSKRILLISSKGESQVEQTQETLELLSSRIRGRCKDRCRSINPSKVCPKDVVDHTCESKHWPLIRFKLGLMKAAKAYSIPANSI